MINFDEFEIRPSKHFRNTWLRKWNWDIYDLRDALNNSEIKKVGKRKYEAYTKHRIKGKTRKLIFVIYPEYKEIFIITGTEGK